jgi:tRNA pseudouridine38-40 synthase
MAQPNLPEQRKPLTPERNLLLVLSYDGTGYYGWQRQKEEVSIQSTVEQAILRITGEAANVVGSGRTDRGVHALGHTAHVFLKSPIRTEKLSKALNAVLPRDIRVVGLREKPASFHARYSARKRWYRYYLYNEDPISPFWDRYSWHFPPRLDIGRMRRCLAVLRGTHDFTSFCALKDENPSKVRTLSQAVIRVSGPMVMFDLAADAFLYNMVRVIVGTLVRSSPSDLTPKRMREILARKDRSAAGETAPAQGLFLMKVSY